MIKSFVNVGQICVAFGVIASAPAIAATSATLDFEGAICGPTGTSVCSDGAAIGESYGSTSAVAVRYQSRNTGVQNFDNFALSWGDDYSGLTNIAYAGGNANSFLRITFTPLDNFEMRLVSFDAGCYIFRVSCQNIPWSLTSLSPTSNDPIDGLVINSGAALPGQFEGDSILVNSDWSVTSLVFDFGPDGFNGGLDNIVFEYRPVDGNIAVPEPASWAMLIAGFGLIGAAMRRRRSITV